MITLKKGRSRLINGFSIRLPIRYYRYYNNGYEKDTFNYFEKIINPNDTVLDIGAHIGLFSVYFSKKLSKKGRVICFEPTPGTFQILEKTVELNNLPNCTLVNAAIADKSGMLNFNLTSKNGEGSNANSLVQIERTVNVTEVKVFSIDDYRRAEKLKINILKIDVEGYELNALRGAEETFIHDKPSGILALHPKSIKKLGQSLEQIWDLLEKYKCHIQHQGKSILKDEFCSKELLFDVEFKSTK
ncbi:MAG: FkbM family methyltransferase [Bacteroidota bacterium]|nr:FkbM family methyltransferase [Bacteroidota bacterium]